MGQGQIIKCKYTNGKPIEDFLRIGISNVQSFTCYEIIMVKMCMNLTLTVEFASSTELIPRAKLLIDVNVRKHVDYIMHNAHM